jgi:hypothetical protein
MVALRVLRVSEVNSVFIRVHSRPFAVEFPVRLAVRKS